MISGHCSQRYRNSMLRILEINKLIANAFFVASVFNDSLKISKFIMICMESHSSVPGWQEFFLIQILLIFSGRCNCYFDIYGWKFTGYQNLICSFSSCQQTFPKANYFRVYRKLITWPIIAKKRKIVGMGSLGEEYLWDLKTLTFATMFNPSNTTSPH